MKATITLTRANHEYLKKQDITMSDYINDVLQQYRTLGPLHERMKKVADQIDRGAMAYWLKDSAPYLQPGYTGDKHITFDKE